jgi:hypothetical protein
MLVFGDRTASEDPAVKLARLADDLRMLAALPPGIERHGRLVSLFIEASEAAQGIADAEFASVGCDAGSALQDAAMAVLMALARAVIRSWEGRFVGSLQLPMGDIRRLLGLNLLSSVMVRRGEGYAFYALYPEAYAAAAQALDKARRTKVIGVRSIGAGLSAVVAAATGAEAPLTLRPTGHPFRREVVLSSELASCLLRDREAQFAVVDEGPGLSGSSLGAVADFLEERGLPAEQIHFFPSHSGDLGPQASPAHRRRWAHAKRHVVDFDSLVLRARDPAHRLEHWVKELIGEPVAPLEDISGGVWRQHRFAHKGDWPPAHIQQERRKFLLRTVSGTWLLKFAGVGRHGERAFDRAKLLSAAGLTPQVAGHRHGFLVERWIEEARPFTLAGFARTALLQHVGHYLAFRSVHFPAPPDSGASLSQLLETARYNTRTALGEEGAKRIAPWAPRIGGLERGLWRIETDNRLHVWEWLIRPNGHLLKTDALDHHAAHDLVGCQDLAWDVAGAVVELDLSPSEQDELCAVIHGWGGGEPDPELIAFLTPCYLAFQLGYYTLAAEALAGSPDEVDRLRTAAGRYADRLRQVLDGQPLN